MHKDKLDLRDISLVCVETRYPELASFAIERCLAGADFKECLLFTSRLHDLPPHIRQVLIAPIESVEAYSAFMVHELGAHFSGTHALVMQWDSFIVDARQWQSAFLDCDYIGAPWSHRPVAVGNGGFSLRSRRLYDILPQLAITQPHPEDYAICELHGDRLREEFGVRFADAGLASSFAFEGIMPAGPTFGFHGFFNFGEVLDDTELTDYLRKCDDAIMHAPTARGLIKQLYRSGRYRMAARILRRRINGGAALFGDACLLALRTGMHALTHARSRPALPRA
ncbi:DUF5672 family protein [Janthinobacterium sp. 13]|uniref:DUF5672 family protein n=1 Tax=Janthinobacterium sp. 13 TaxID=2035211 RepID=UPI000C16E414|nr:DUF5672 family protein [Janthinobacterium sp. 13]PIF08465.1 hypothetical protein CLU94_0424 [Janthinobacterium sp. 13]